MYLQQFENTRAKADVYLRRAPNYTKIRGIRENNVKIRENTKPSGVLDLSERREGFVSNLVFALVFNCLVAEC